MLLAYIDEIGETGAFVSRSDARFNTSPAFGYAGFLIGAADARRFGQIFTEEKRTLFAADIAASSHPAQWEKKGSEVFHRATFERFPQQLRVFCGLVRRLRGLGGCLFTMLRKSRKAPLGRRTWTLTLASGARCERPSTAWPATRTTTVTTSWCSWTR